MTGSSDQAARGDAAADPKARIMPMLGRLWRDWLSPHKAMLLLNLALIGAVAGTTSLYPIVVQKALDGFESRSEDIMFWAPIAVVAAVSVKAVALYFQRIVTNGVLAKVDEAIQRAMFRKLIHADIARLDREAPAATAARFTTDIAVLRDAITRLINVALRDGLTVIGLFASLLYIDWELTLYALVGLPIAAVPIAAIGQRLRRIAKATQVEAGRMNSRVTEALGGVRLSKTYRLEDYLVDRTDSIFARQRELKVRAADHQARIDPLLEGLAGIGLAIVFYAIGTRIAAGESSIGEFMSFVAAFLIAGQPLRAFGQLYAVTLQGMAAAERIYDVLDARPGVAERAGAAPMGRAEGALALEGVEFAYEDGTKALDGVSLEIPAGAKVAFVGRSGAGKSTIFNLIPRLYDPTGGRVTLDGRDLRDITLAGLRDNIAVVSQEAVIFDDTVAANLAFGRPGASREEIEAAARAAQAHDFIARLPEGYDAMAGERGGRFSGGERQRLSIARAILRDAPVLLLDEATSALDAENEDAIRTALDRLAQGRTTLVIAHRLSTVRDADIIVAMDKGRIVETGTHAELLAQGGLYADLHRLQFRDAEG
ncbi:ABC transporter ATP-binding protein [Rhodovulum sp. DZ06]|uniref:ABC transporter ATP-binding protein n=1 Tax=Rhodovulum sp. DZ06 TaxID=3425126 RepID=UPI003D350878